MKKLVMCVVALLAVALMVTSPAFADGDATATATAGPVNASVEQNYGDTVGRVGMPVPPQMTYPFLPGYFGPATNQPNYMKAEAITLFKKTFNRNEIEALLSSNPGLSRMKMRKNIFTDSVPKSDRLADDSVTVHLTKPEGNYAPVGYITIYSKTTERDSVDVFYNALEEAINTLECEEVLLVGEGAMNVLKSWGAGIGLSYTQAFLKDSNNAGDATGGSGTGGTGVSWGEAGYRAKPYAQFILLNNLDVTTKHRVQK